MNLGVEEQAQRRKKDKKRSRKKKGNDTQDAPSQEPIQTNHHKIYQTKIIKIQQRKIGLIIGPGGKNIRELYELTHCDIILPQASKKKKQLQPDLEPITSGLSQYQYDENCYVYDSWRENEDSKQTQNKKKDIKPTKKNQADDQEEEEEEDEDDPRRLVEIKLRGTPEEIRDAELEINFMKEHGRLMLEHERDPNTKSSSNLYYDDKKKDGPEWEEIAQDMRIPSKICGMLIGGGGQRVKELMDMTGCEIWVDWDKGSHIEAGVSTVHLKGTRYSVQNAKEEIRRIQRLFEKGSNTLKWEVPAHCAKALFGESGQNLKQLQMEYNCSINVKNFSHERRSIKIGNEDLRVQRTMLIMLVGEDEAQVACKKHIDKLVGMFTKCHQCKFLKQEDEGYMDNHGWNWYCNDCWDEFNGVVRSDDDKKKNQDHQLSNRLQRVDLKEPTRPNALQPVQPAPPRKPPMRSRGGGGARGGGGYGGYNQAQPPRQPRRQYDDGYGGYEQQRPYPTPQQSGRRNKW